MPSPSRRIALPAVLDNFCVRESHRSPFEFLNRYLARKVGLSTLAPSATTLSRADYAAFRTMTRRWLQYRGLLPHFEHYVASGVAAPLFGPAASRGFAAVAVGVGGAA